MRGRCLMFGAPAPLFDPRQRGVALPGTLARTVGRLSLAHIASLRADMAPQVTPFITTTAVRDDGMSLRTSYDEFRAREIDFYKEIIPHQQLMRLADSALQSMEARGELMLGDVMLKYEVDDIVAARLRLPSFRAWTRRQSGGGGVLRPWSDRADQLALELPTVASSAVVLLLQPRSADLWQALSGHRHHTLVVEPDDERRARLLDDAHRVDGGEYVTALPAYDAIDPETLFSSVCYSPAACADLADWEAEELIESLKQRTVRGGWHVVDGLLRDRASVPRSMLKRSYATWVKQKRRGAGDSTFVAAHSG